METEHRLIHIHKSLIQTINNNTLYQAYKESFMQKNSILDLYDRPKRSVSGSLANLEDTKPDNLDND